MNNTPAIPVNDAELNPRQEKFCREYMIDLNARRAAVRAGYSPKDKRTPTRLLQMPLVNQRIAELQSQQFNQSTVRAEEIIEELRKIAFCNVRDLVDAENDISKLRALSPDKTAAISSIKTIRTETKESTRTVTTLTLHNKLGALIQLGRHAGIFNDRTDTQNFIKQLIIQPV